MVHKLAVFVFFEQNEEQNPIRSLRPNGRFGLKQAQARKPKAEK